MPTQKEQTPSEVVQAHIEFFEQALRPEHGNGHAFVPDERPDICATCKWIKPEGGLIWANGQTSREITGTYVDYLRKLLQYTDQGVIDQFDIH